MHRKLYVLAKIKINRLLLERRNCNYRDKIKITHIYMRTKFLPIFFIHYDTFILLFNVITINFLQHMYSESQEGKFAKPFYYRDSSLSQVNEIV